MPDRVQLMEFLIAIGAGGVITTAVTGLINKRKNNAEAGKLDAESDHVRAKLEIEINGAALNLIESLRREVGALTSKLEAMEKRGIECDKRNRDLEEQIVLLRKHVGVCEDELGIDNSK